MRQCVYSNFHTPDTAVRSPHAVYVERERLIGPVTHDINAVEGQSGSGCAGGYTGDASVEPFSQRLGVIATGTRAALELWRVAEDEAGVLHGIAFAALRDSTDRPMFDFYCAVDPSLRRQGLGRALSEPAVISGAVLRARVRDDSKPGRAFLQSLGFVETGGQLMLHWNGEKRIEPVPMPALRIRHGSAQDQALVERLSSAAWKGRTTLRLLS